MNKAELLADLAGRFDYVAEPILQDGAGFPDGAEQYSVKVRSDAGDTSGYQNVRFCVIDEGGQDELAFFLNVDPVDPATAGSEFYKWIRNTRQNNPDNFKGLQIHWWDETTAEAIYSILTGDPLERKFYWVRMGGGPPAEIANFNIEDYRRDCRVWPDG